MSHPHRGAGEALRCGDRSAAVAEIRAALAALGHLDADEELTTGKHVAFDVFDQEPLPLEHPFRSLPNLLATPHIGYVSRGLYARFYQDAVANIRNWLDSEAEGSRAPRAAP